MAVISGSDYNAIATHYGNIKTLLTSASEYLYDAVYKIVLFNSLEPTADLFNEFYNSYLSNTSQIKSDIPLIPAVKKLNSHVMSRGGYASVNAFLEATGATVPQSWADLCASAGTTIDEDHIAG
jgi:hypothetical protein